MQITYLSPTKLEQSRLCMARLAAKYDLTQNNGYEEEQGDPAKIGTLAHAAAKIWYRGGVQEPDGTWRLVTTPDQAFTDAMHECSQNKNYDGTPNSQLPGDPSGVEEAKTLFMAIVAHYPRENLKVLYAERKYKGTLRNGVPVNLIIDLIVDRGHGVCEVIDFKTGFLSCSTEEMYDKDQVLMNLIAVNDDPDLAQFSTKQFSYYWVKKGYETGPVTLTYQSLKDYTDWLALRYQEILNEDKPKETLNRFCKNCGRKDQCGEYTNFIAEAYGVKEIKPVDKITAEQTTKLSDEDLMAQIDRMSGQEDMLAENVKALKAELRGRIEKSGQKEIEGDRYKARLQQTSRTSYQPTTVLSLCQQYKIDVAPLVSISKKECDSAFKDVPGALTALEMTAHRGATQPFIVVNANNKRKPATGGGRKKKADVDPTTSTASTTPTTPTAGVTINAAPPE